MDYETQKKISEAIDYLSLNYPDQRLNNNKHVGGSARDPEVISGVNYIRTGMKQSQFEHVIYDGCTFFNVALTGSQFRSVRFYNTILTGNSFACCDFYDIDIDGTKCNEYTANNLSLSSFELCSFMNLTFSSSGILGSYFHNCRLNNVKLRSCTLEGTTFANCHLSNCDLTAVNVEFSQFSKGLLDSVRFPFYQFPYVIGAANIISDPNSNVLVQAGEKIVSMEEYREHLQKLFFYFMDKGQHFPMCNLALAQNDVDAARQYLMDGVLSSLRRRDFRMIRHFCKLALHHDIIDEFTRQRILQEMDVFLQRKDIPDTQLNYFMTYIGTIRTLLYSASSNSAELHFKIATRTKRGDTKGIKYVNSLMADLNESLSQTIGSTGYQLKVSSFSPFAIDLSVVLSDIGSIASIASLIWSIIAATNNKRTAEPSAIPQIDVAEYRGHVDDKIEKLKVDLLQMRQKYSEEEFNEHIGEIIQQLKTDLDELYEKDIMIFKVDNNDKKPKV